jgi:hypothetical protein
MKNKTFLLLGLVVMTNNLFGQTNTDDYYDIRIKKLLDSKSINYTINKRNDFNITVITENAPNERTQLVTITSKTNRYDEFEIREIHSTALKIKKDDIKTKLLYEILLENGKLKNGSWEIDEYESVKEYYYLLFSIKVGTNISGDDLKSMLFLVANEADKIEKLYGNGIDTY